VLSGKLAKATTSEAREALRVEIEKEMEEAPTELIPPRLFTNDVTPEKLQALLVEHGERMAVFSAEPGIFQIMGGRYSGGEAQLDVFLQAYSGDTIRVDRATRQAHIDSPALTFGMMVQNELLNDISANKRFSDSGLLARFLYAMPESNVGKRDVRSHIAIPESISREYADNLMALLAERKMNPGKPAVLTLSKPALDFWLDFADFIEKNHGEGRKYESITTWTSKLPGTVARIAAIFEIAEMGPCVREVGQDAMWRAVGLANLLIEHAVTVFSLIGTDAVEVDAKAIIKWIRENEVDHFSRSNLQKRMEGRFRKVERLTDALKRLQDNHVLRHYVQKNQGARPSDCYDVNPRLSRH
jgi:putative DNA primase/helicase